MSDEPAARDWWELTKPGITRMVALTTLFGFHLASPWPHDLVLLVNTVLGSALACAGAAALNMAVEGRADAKMKRTCRRPVPAGRIAPGTAAAFGGTLASLGVFLLAAKVNPITAILAAVTVVLYIAVYTPLKSVSWWCTILGAVPGAIPPVMGWTAVTGRVDPAAWILFGVLFFWQLPHFFAIGWLCREDYRQAGFPMLPVIDPGGLRTARQVVVQTLLLVAVSLVPYFLGWAGPAYLVGAAASGAAFLAFGLAFALRRDDLRARRLFLASLAYLPLVLALLSVGRIR